MTLFDRYQRAMEDFTQHVEDMAQGNGVSALFHTLAVMSARRVEATLAVMEAERLIEGGE